jgi:hypothetical protein
VLTAELELELDLQLRDAWDAAGAGPFDPLTWPVARLAFGLGVLAGRNDPGLLARLASMCQPT